MKNPLLPTEGSGSADCATHGPLCPHPARCKPTQESSQLRTEERTTQPTIHKLPSTREAVRIVSAADGLFDGDVIYVPSEGVVGVAHSGKVIAFSNKVGAFTPLSALDAVKLTDVPTIGGYGIACKMALIMSRVERGARWLDVHHAGWLTVIDASLYLGDQDEWDVIYAATRGKVGWRNLEDHYGAPWMVLHGFSTCNITDYGPDYNYLDLGEIWRDIAAARRDAPQAPMSTIVGM